MSNKSNEFDSINLIKYLWKTRKILIIIGLLAAVISSIVSLMLQNKYTARVVLYSSRSSSINFSASIGDGESVSKFGEEREAEQMIQILESRPVREKITSQYNLMKHYDIDTTSKLKQYNLIKTYEENITFSRNDKGAVVINVIDHSPDTAAIIANHISELFDSTKNDLIHERALLEYNIKKKRLEKLEKELDVILDTIAKITALGVASNEAYVGLVEAMIAEKDKKEKEKYLKKMEMTDKYASVLHAFYTRASVLNGRIAALEASCDISETAAKENISHKFIVDSAVVPDKKTYPVRWLIVVISTLATVSVALLSLLTVEKFRLLKETLDKNN